MSGICPRLNTGVRFVRSSPRLCHAADGHASRLRSQREVSLGVVAAVRATGAARHTTCSKLAKLEGIFLWAAQVITLKPTAMSAKAPLVAPVYLPGKEPLPPGVSEADREQLQEMAKYQRYTTMAMESCVTKTAIAGVLGFGLGGFFSLMSASFAIDDPLRQTTMEKMAAEQAKKDAEKKAAAAGTAGGTEVPKAAPTAEASATAAKSAPVRSALAASTSAAPSGSSAVAQPIKAAANGAAKNLAAEPPMPDINTMQGTKLFFIQTGRNMWRSGKGFGKVGALYSGIECLIEGYRAKNDLANPIAAGFFSGAILARNSGPQAMIGGGVAFAAFSGAIDAFLRREKKDED